MDAKALDKNSERKLKEGAVAAGDPKRNTGTREGKGFRLMTGRRKRLIAAADTAVWNYGFFHCTR